MVTDMLLNVVKKCFVQFPFYHTRKEKMRRLIGDIQVIAVNILLHQGFNK